MDVWIPIHSDAPEKAVLEELSALEAIVAVERSYPPRSRVLIETGPDGPAIPGEVSTVEERETDCLIRVVFRDGYRWTSEDWTPDHAIKISESSSGAAAG